MNPANAPRDPELEARLREHVGAGWDVYAFRQVTSTMDVAHAIAQSSAPAPRIRSGSLGEGSRGESRGKGTLVWAARQDHGRGRLGRVWESPEGGVYLSLVVRPTRPSPQIPQLSLVAGLAAVEAIQQLTGLFPSIRWPNDVLLGGLKVAGVLVEAKSDAVVVGIGVNVTTSPEALPDGAISLAASGATSCDPYQLTGVLCSRFHAWYDGWTTQGFAPIRDALRPWIGLFGHPVHISAGSDRFEGTASDLDEDGRLLVRLDSGLMRHFEMGEVTLLR